MRNILLGVAATLVVLGIIAFTCLHFGIVPVNADSTPSSLERWAARTAIIAAVTRSMYHGRNPVQGSAALHDGAQIYRLHCELCHGSAGHDESAIAKGLYQTPPQFAKDDVSEIPYGYLSWVIAHGIRLTGMPSFGKTLSRQQINEVTLYVAQMKTDPVTPEAVVLRAPLRPLFSILRGTRACTYIPTPGARPHHFAAVTQTTPDGAFIVEHFYNRGISEVSVLGYDAPHRQYERTEISKAGTLDISVADAPHKARWSWRSIAGSTPGTVLDLQPRSDGSYDFVYSNGGGTGQCSAPSNIGA
jgi:thiosulfate dehydrogenase